MRWNPKRRSAVLVVFLIGVLAGFAEADVPRMINYQGHATDAKGTPLDTTIQMRFYIFSDSTGGLSLWWEEHPSVEINAGLFEVMLGSVKPIGSGVFTGADRWFSLGIGSDPPQSPRKRIVSSAYAYHAKHADTTENALHAKHADTAEYAINSTGGAGGWLDTGSRVRLISASDTVGIGTAQPLEKLHVHGHLMLSDNFDIKFGTTGSQINQTGTDLVVDVADDLHLQPNDNIYIREGTGTTFMTIDPGSKELGIGTTAPEDMVHIVNDAMGGYAFVRVESNHATVWQQAGLHIETPQNQWRLRMDDYTNNKMPDGALGLRSQDAATEVMTWSEDGRVGIGTTDPLYKLHVDGDAMVNGTLYADLPSNSVSSDDILDETGVVYGYMLNSPQLTSDWQTIDQESIEVPDAGKILAIATAYFRMDHSAADSTYFWMGLSSAPDVDPILREGSATIPSSASAGTYRMPATCQRVFSVYTAGTFDVYVVATSESSNNVWAMSRTLSLIYIPSSYVAAPANRGSDQGEMLESRVTSLGSHPSDEIGATRYPPAGQSQMDGLLDEIETLKRRIEALEGR